MPPVQVTYSGPIIYLQSDQWTQVKTSLISQLPLRNLHWKPATRPSIRTIQELAIDLVPFETTKDDPVSQIPTSMLDRPFLNVFVISCEDSDVYKNTAKKQIKDWHTIITNRRNQEWLILLVVRPDTRSAGSRLFKIQGSVIDKIRADFNTGRRDRCVELTFTNKDDPTMWMDLIAKVKEAIVSSFDAHVAVREEDVKRSEAQRQLPGWNFCTFFILKESLATSFEGMNLFEDAQIQYDELEASFFQVLKEKNLSWFGKLGGNLPGDDSSPLLTASDKPYRELFLTNSISVFDFRIYLLARQCALLGQMGRVLDVARKASMFIGGFSRTLRENESSLTEYFIESWIYCAALNVVEHCDNLVTTSEIDTASQTTFNALKGELLELARNQLDKIGIRVGHLPPSPPFSMSLSAPPKPLDPDRPPTKITRKQLLEAIESQDKFDVLYVELSKRTIDMYASAGRRKFARKVHLSLAALDFLRQRFPSAHQMFTSLPAHYTPQKWTPLEAFMLAKNLEAHQAMYDAGQTDNSSVPKPPSPVTRDREWINTVLAFLKAWVVIGARGGAREMGMDGMTDEEKKSWLATLVKDLGVAARTLDSDLNVQSHPAFAIDIAPGGQARSAGDRDGSFVDVIIKNNIGVPVNIEGASINLTGHDTDQVAFSCGPSLLELGETKLELFCPIPVFGTFSLESSELFLSKLRCQWPAQILTSTSPTTPNYPKSFSPVGPLRQPALVRIPRDYSALDIQVVLPKEIQLDAPNMLVFVIQSGRNEVSRGNLKVSGPTGITFRMNEAKLVSGKTTLEGTSQGISIGGLKSDAILEIAIPHSTPSQGSSVAVAIELRYDNVDQLPTPTPMSRLYEVTKKIFIGMPVQVNVRDFFRGKTLFSKFTVETHLPQPIRIKSAHLDGGSNLLIESSRPDLRRVMTVTPGKPANFLFRLSSERERLERDTFHFHLTYRTLREEVEELMAHHLKTVLKSYDGTPEDEEAVTRSLTSALAADAKWVESYLVTGEIEIQAEEDEDKRLAEIAKEVIERLKARQTAEQSEDTPQAWKRLTIPVDVPFMNILSAVRIQLPTVQPKNSIPLLGAIEKAAMHIYAGQPIAATLAINTSFHWGSKGAKNKEGYKMRFDVDQSGNDWLVSGRKRGDFIAMDQADHNVPLTLIPLRHGELSLPQVSVWPLPLDSKSDGMEMKSMALPSSETYQVHAAERVLVLPRGGRSTFVVGMSLDQ